MSGAVQQNAIRSCRDATLYPLLAVRIETVGQRVTASATRGSPVEVWDRGRDHLSTSATYTLEGIFNDLRGSQVRRSYRIEAVSGNGVDRRYQSVHSSLCLVGG